MTQQIRSTPTVRDSNWRLRVLDGAPVFVDTCRQLGVQAGLAAALSPRAIGDKNTVALNLMLRHLMAVDERATRTLVVHSCRCNSFLLTTSLPP